MPGVIHISQLQKDSVNRVEEIIKPGQEVNVWVRRVHEDRIELTMVEPLELEWREIKTEMVVKGKVSRLEPYGVFVEIGAERPGLVHVSEISHTYVKNPSEILKEGDEVEAKILDVDRRKKQIRLSIKAVLPKPEEVEVTTMKTEPRKERKAKKSRNKEESVEEVESQAPELTSFQIAFQKAQARSNNKADSGRKKNNKSNFEDEQEEIFNRTLGNRITPG